MKRLAAVVLILLTSHASAGGDVFLVEKVDFTVSDSWGGFVLKFKMAYEHKTLMGCSALTIEGTYSRWHWQLRHRSVTAPTWREHRKALQLIDNATTPFALATIGQALKVTARPCVFESEGIAPIRDAAGRFVGVTTFYLTA